MRSSRILVTLIGICCLVVTNAAKDVHHWTYGSGAEGVDTWPNNFPECGGVNQSPINIEQAETVYSVLLEANPLKLIGYDKSVEGLGVEIHNNGHTVVMTLGNTHDISITGAALSLYRLAQIHWHWGSTPTQGSEHLVDGISYPMEMHLVHFNTRYEGNVSTILSSADGIAVLGVFIKVQDHNPLFDELIKHFDNASAHDVGRIPITPPTMRSFLPSDLTKFYRYSGSLTTPPCSEAVTWTVFNEPMTISEEQLNAFRTKLVKNKSPNKTPTAENLMHDNYRPVMPLGSRKVFSSYNIRSTNAHGWAYHKSSHGPDPSKWHTTYEQCGGKNQSPIHIKHSEAKFSPQLSASPWKLHNYANVPGKEKPVIKNNGHTVAVSMPKGVSVSGGGLPAKFNLMQFHWHWGNKNAQGSEHLLNGKRYAAELHFVHSNADYADFDAIKANGDGLAVLGVFVEIGDHNAAFDPILERIEHVKYMSENGGASLNLKSIRGLLPSDMSEFYRYAGSLTTPSCYEIVMWTVFKNPITISEKQLDQFRQCYSVSAPNKTVTPTSLQQAQDDGLHEKSTETHDSSTETKSNCYIVDNFRPVQKIGYRIVKYAKINPDLFVYDAGVQLTSNVLLASLAMVSIILLRMVAL